MTKELSKEDKIRLGYLKHCRVDRYEAFVNDKNKKDSRLVSEEFVVSSDEAQDLCAAYGSGFTLLAGGACQVYAGEDPDSPLLISAWSFAARSEDRVVLVETLHATTAPGGLPIPEGFRFVMFFRELQATSIFVYQDEKNMLFTPTFKILEDKPIKTTKSISLKDYIKRFKPKKRASAWASGDTPPIHAN